MCRSITMLRGLEPAATTDEVEAAVAARMLEELLPRKQPPKTVPPNRRR